MSKLWQLGALMKKNLILMKRNWLATIVEIVFPIVLMILLVLLRGAIGVVDNEGQLSNDENFTLLNSTALLDTKEISELKNNNMSNWNGLSLRNPLEICKNRQVIASIGTDLINIKKITDKISEFFPKINSTFTFKSFSTINETNNYIMDPGYGASPELPELCFGFYFNSENQTKFDYSLHYFDSIIRGAIQDTPNTLIKSLDPFQRGPDQNSFSKWLNSGYLQIYKIINDVILGIVTNDQNARIDFGIVSQKYDAYKEDPFGIIFGFILPFFLVIAYLCPLSIFVFRMVKDKESKVKEGMKIMGLSESIYFLSYFLQWLIQNTIYAIINSIILTNVFTNIGFIFIFGFFWLFGMCIFSLAYFFQSLMDKTRIAMIISILVYFVMYFISSAVISDQITNLNKILISLLPPTCLAIGMTVLAKFQSSFVDFSWGDLTTQYNNYSASDMYIMLFVDTLVYLFLGYYLQNVLSQQYGIRRPWYFLCTKKFWSKNNNIKKFKNVYPEIDKEGIENSKISRNKEFLIDINKNVKDNNDYNINNFQSEQLYEDKIKSGDNYCLKIENLRKIFDDGKVAVDGLNLNLYNEEIFALLGHNGAGKSTTISILCGLYEATSGTAIYEGENILEDENMEDFRKKLGICPQHDILFDNLTVEEHLNMFCVFKGVENAKIAAEIEKILHDVHMYDKKDELSKNLSGGQKRKLSIAIALSGGSQIVFLDEPSSGMDITSRRNLWEILKKCVGNRIIVLTTHYMEEAAILGNRIGIVSNGKLKCCGNSLFLIDRFGKYISLNIYKSPDANDEDIINFIRARIPDVEYEILSEEILFRIPKPEENDVVKMNFSFKQFFTELDANLELLKINSYGASMPTLEDVFLNVSADTKHKLITSNKSSELSKLKNKDDDYNLKYQETTGIQKFIVDLKVSLKKRFLQIIRDKKTFVLEIFCPIILVLIGLGVSSSKFFRPSISLNVNLGELPYGQNIILNKNYFNNDTMPIEFKDEGDYNTTFEYKDVNNTNELRTTLYNYNNEIYSDNNIKSLGSYYIIEYNKIQNLFKFVIYVNTQARNSPIIYAEYITKFIIEQAASNINKNANNNDKNISINYVHVPFPTPSKLQKQGEQQNTTNLVFFVSIAFALIPANFITIIIKERESNTKHLQIISGISLLSYWIANYIFEIVKYIFIAGINLLIIYSISSFPTYLWLITLLYGLSMISFTYTFALLFQTESTAQNVVVLINFLFGSLGGTVVSILRITSGTVEIGKTLQYIFRIVPSFSFAFAYNQLLSSILYFATDYPESFFNMVVDTDKYIIQPEYVGGDCIYMASEFFGYMFVLIMWESSRNLFKFRKADSPADFNLIKDENVQNEITKANTEMTEEGKYSIRVKNLEKKFTGTCSSKGITAVNKLSFCLEFGECFALLGVNGAGKTTTFKSLTLEHLATSGEIFINGLEITKNFNRVRNLVGYCPQFDAIFDYMTVYENLEFYAKLKGIPDKIVPNVVNSLMEEMNLAQYKNKISGNLSGGNKRKLSVGIAMIGNPPIVLLDEPSTGMDPEARRFMWAVIHKISTRSKNSSVILTTHSMEEAETLCRRMGIMVAGQFKCIGTGQGIKDKYGYGFEIDLRIQIMPELVLENILKEFNLKSNLVLNNLEDVRNALTSINKVKLISQFNENSLGREILDEFSSKGKITLKRLIEWTFYTENALRCTDVILNNFEDVCIVEFWDNNYKLKIKKNGSTNTIGFLFGLMEDQKKNCSLAEYTISQTSLEQIFNKFASEDDADALISSSKKELKITKDFVEKMIG